MALLERLFTYGSLMPGGQYHYLLEQAPGEWQEATVLGFLDKDGWGHTTGYPALVVDYAGSPIEGMLLSSTKLVNLWAVLDEFEGTAYQRILVTVRLTDGSVSQAFVYQLHPSLQSAHCLE